MQAKDGALEARDRETLAKRSLATLILAKDDSGSKHGSKGLIAEATGVLEEIEAEYGQNAAAQPSAAQNGVSPTVARPGDEGDEGASGADDASVTGDARTASEPAQGGEA